MAQSWVNMDSNDMPWPRLEGVINLFPILYFTNGDMDYIEMAQFSKHCKVGAMTIVNDNELIKITN